jgi:alpha-N-arabinofuranosidase
VPVLDAVATHDPETGGLVLFAVNRSLTETLSLDVDLRGFAGLRVVEALTLANPDVTWSATADDDSSVLPRTNPSAAVVDGRATAQLPPVSWSVIRLGRA